MSDKQVPFLSPRVRQMYIDNLERQRDEAHAERDALRAELSAVREALGAYDDSDLASLAETLVAQRRLLAEELVQIPALEVGDKALELARSILEEAESDD